MRRSPTQPRSAATVEAIVTAAEQVVDREGAEALTTNRVAEVAGVSIGTLYQYFPNKEALVGALLDRHTAMFRQALEAALTKLPSGSVTEIVETAAEGMLRAYAAQRPVHHQLFALRRLPEVHARLERSLDGIVELVVAFLRARPDLDVPDPRTTAFVLVRAIDGVLVALADRMQEQDPGVIVRELARLVARYIDGRGRSVTAS